MPIKFRDCPHCGRGVLEVAFRLHIAEFHSQPEAESIPKHLKRRPPGSAQMEALPQVARQNTDTVSPIDRLKDTSSNVKGSRSVRSEPEVNSAGSVRETHERKNKRHLVPGWLPEANSSVFLQRAKDEQREAVEWKIALLEKSGILAQPKLPRADSSKAGNSTKSGRKRLPPTPLTKARQPKTKFVTVTAKCSCDGENENCFKCGGSGIEVKQLAIARGSDTTLFARDKHGSNLGSFANDSRGNSFGVREKGSFDSRPLYDDLDDESMP